MTNLHIPIIVSLQGIAALGVVLFHFVNTITGFVTNETIRLVFEFGGLGVNLFFLISGIVIPLFMLKANYNYSMLSSFWLRRLTRVEPSYLAAVILGIIFYNFRDFVKGGNLAPVAFDIVLHLGYLVPFFEESKWINPVFWTLAIEFQYYLLLSLVFPLLSGQILLRAFVIVALLSLRLLSEDRDFLIFWLPVFLVGILYALALAKRLSPKELALWYVILGAILLYDNRASFVVLVLALPIIQFYGKLRIPRLHWVGNISYSLYLFHGFSGTIFYQCVFTLRNYSLGKVFSGVIGSFFRTSFCIRNEPAY